ncbi:MAG: glycosyltransferase family 39 protein [archaeon]
MSETDVEQKKSFFSDKYNIFILGIIIFAFVLLLRYFNINQALWWDEAEYLSIAKHWAFGVPFDVSYIRPPFFPALMALFYVLGANEFVIRLFMLVVALAATYFTYLVAKQLFDKRIALVSSFMLAASHLTIFYTARILIDVLVTLLWLLVIFFFWKGYVRKESKYYLWLMGVAVGLGASLKMPFILIVAPLVLYVFLNEGFSMFKNKRLWLAVLFFFIGILPYFLYFNLSYGGLPFISTPSYGFGKGDLTFDFYSMVFPLVLRSPIPFLEGVWIFNIFLILFLVGMGYIVVNLFLGWDLLRKEQSLKVYAFLLAWMVVPFVFLSMISQAEDRYLFMIYPAVFMVSSLMLFKCYDFVKKYNKYLALAFVFAVLLSYAYAQISYGDALTKSKSASYLQLKEAALWMKERSGPDDLILNSGVPQNTYYSERNTTFYPENEADFDKFITDYKPKFMVISVFERSPDWTYDWPEKNQDRVVPVQAYYADAEQKQPLLVIYQFVDNSTS